MCPWRRRRRRSRYVGDRCTEVERNGTTVVQVRDVIQVTIAMYHSKAYSAASATSRLAASTIPRREPTERDVQIEILFCGICHSDLHTVRNEWCSVMTTT